MVERKLRQAAERGEEPRLPKGSPLSPAGLGMPALVAEQTPWHCPCHQSGSHLHARDCQLWGGGLGIFAMAWSPLGTCLNLSLPPAPTCRACLA